MPETQTQFVNPTQFSGGTESLDDREQLPEDCEASRLEKTPVLSNTGEKSPSEACRTNTSTPPTTPPSKNKVGAQWSYVPSQIEIIKYGYKTPSKKPFELPDKLEVTPTHLTPTPELDAWFVDNDDQFHCLALIQNLHEFPIKSSEEWLNNNFCQFRKFVNDNNLSRVKVLTNMWLDDGNQHSFSVKTPEDNYSPSAKARLEKDFEFEEINKKYADRKEKDIFSSLNCKVTDLLSSPDRKSIVTSLKKVSTTLMTCQKHYSEHFRRYEKQEIEMFNQIMSMKLLEQKTSEKNVELETQVAKLEANIDKLRFQLRQKNVHESDLRKTYSAQKKEQKALSENTILKLEQELMKIKNTRAKKTDSSRLEIEKLKESLKSTKILHKDQLQLKDTQIVEQNSCTKSLKVQIRQLEKSLASVESKFTAFQRKAASNIAKLENKRELFEVKEKAKRDNENKKKREKENEKQLQKI